MFNSHLSMQMFQSKLTLVLLLVVFVSQLFPTCVAADLHSTELHYAEMSLSEPHHLENSLAQELQQDCCHTGVNNCSHMVEVSDQDEHDNDFHTACHPPAQLSFFAQSNGVKDKSQFLISYQDRSYAPPIPPPYC
ncbi:hypothetical protein [Shewanella sp. GutDb-MelDb]|uniref:hypothetical protein n=1 Tax=Shewanella sp. GutDb-MelDb TaxID=2058316 RepID=UPI000C7B422A|nr:hypothetical protein [Shewanella sp. GutDb-MelDb]PKG56244.1 hypothetical protein CXF82_15795 [Shewanella sp. GutDb-MelDb]PKG75638.1 hypothetical protein CXF86_06380 [Shewanella sp. GutCb]